MPSFEYVRARSIDEAIAHLATRNARVHAGGTDLLGCVRDRIFPVDRIVSIRGIKSLSGIDETPEGATIGSLTTIAQLAASPVVARLFPGLAIAAGEVASPQLRNQGTIGGNLCQKPRCWYYRGEFNCLRKGGDTCYAMAGENKFHCVLGGENCFMVHPSDTAPMLIALGASLVASGPKGARRIAVEDLYVSPSSEPTAGDRSRTPGRSLRRSSSLRLPERHYSSYRKIRARRSWDFALAGIALALQFDGPRIAKAGVALSGAAPVPWRSKEVEEVIAGQSLDRSTVAKAASSVIEQANPLAQNGYKVSLFAAALEEELERAAGRTAYERTRRQRRSLVNASGRVDRFPDCRHFSAEEKRSGKATCPSHHDRIRRTDVARQTPGHQVPEGRHALECHSVEAHHAASFVFVGSDLQHGVARGQSSHHAEARTTIMATREIAILPGIGKAYEAEAEKRRAKHDESLDPCRPFTGSEIPRAYQGLRCRPRPSESRVSKDPRGARLSRIWA